LVTSFSSQLKKGRWTINQDASDHQWQSCHMIIDYNSSNYLKIIDKWHPVVFADVLGGPHSGWDYRVEVRVGSRDGNFGPMRPKPGPARPIFRARASLLGPICRAELNQCPAR
jgi:hypothetical protein